MPNVIMVRLLQTIHYSARAQESSGLRCTYTVERSLLDWMPYNGPARLQVWELVRFY